VERDALDSLRVLTNPSATCCAGGLFRVTKARRLNFAPYVTPVSDAGNRPKQTPSCTKMPAEPRHARKGKGSPSPLFAPLPFATSLDFAAIG
jgi:hypothetical protein